jgi:RNA polymerase sigma-70 factor (ECF subfamily)
MQISDAAAVKQVRSGDRDAFRPLVERYSHMVFVLAFRMTNSEPDAEEIVQESFLRAYRALPSFEARSNFATWLYRIATNCSLDLLNRRKNQPQSASETMADEEDESPEQRLPSLAPDPERQMYSAELQGKISAAMNLLTPVEKAAFVLRHFEGRSVEEIAASLKVKTGAAKQSIFRAVQKMRTALEPAIATPSRAKIGRAPGTPESRSAR